MLGCNKCTAFRSAIAKQALLHSDEPLLGLPLPANAINVQHTSVMLFWQPQQGVAINEVAYNVVQGAQWPCIS